MKLLVALQMTNRYEICIKKTYEVYRINLADENILTD